MKISFGEPDSSVTLEITGMPERKPGQESLHERGGENKAAAARWRCGTSV